MVSQPDYFQGLLFCRATTAESHESGAQLWPGKSQAEGPGLKTFVMTRVYGPAKGCETWLWLMALDVFLACTKLQTQNEGSQP